jgi:hypothetical protein
MRRHGATEPTDSELDFGLTAFTRLEPQISEQGQSAEVLADIQRRALNGIVVVTEKALAKAP